MIPTERLLLLEAKDRQDHAKRCKKDLSACKVCQANIKWFGELPLPTLSKVLEEPMAGK